MSTFLRFYAKQRTGHDARNRGFGLLSCSRGLVFPQGDTTGPKSRGLVFPEGGIADPQMSNEATDGLAPSVFDHFSGAVRADSCFFRQRAKRTQGEKRRVRIRMVLPRPVLPQEDTTGPTCRGRVFPDGDIAGPHSNTAFDSSLKHSTSGVVLAAPILFFTVVPFVIWRGRRVIFLRGAVYDGRKGQSF